MASTRKSAMTAPGVTGMVENMGNRGAAAVVGRATAAAAVAFAVFGGTAQASEIVGSTLVQNPNAGFITPLTMVALSQPADNPTPNPLSPR